MPIYQYDCLNVFLAIEIHNVGEGAFSTSPVLLKKIQETERPSAKKQIRSFIGLTSFYRKYIPNFSEIALPLTDLTRKGQPSKAEWGEPQEKAYMTLKALLAKPPILKLLDFSKQVVLRTDASDLGIAAILMQEHDKKMFPVALASKKLLKRQRNYSVSVLSGLSRNLKLIYGDETLSYRLIISH